MLGGGSEERTTFVVEDAHATGKQGPKSVRGSDKCQGMAAAGTLRREWINLQFLHDSLGGSAPSRRTGKDCLGLLLG